MTVGMHFYYGTTHFDAHQSFPPSFLGAQSVAYVWLHLRLPLCGFLDPSTWDSGFSFGLRVSVNFRLPDITLSILPNKDDLAGKLTDPSAFANAAPRPPLLKIRPSVNCGHIESEPPLAVGSLIRQFRDAGKLGTVPEASTSSATAKATEAEAEAETNAGLKKRKKTDSDPGPSKKSRSKQDSDTPQGERVDVGHIVVLGKPGALALGRTKVPDAKEINTMIANKLAIASTPEQRLRINTAWPTCLCNKYFASLLPDLFNHISLHPPKSNPSDPEEIQQQRVPATKFCDWDAETESEGPEEEEEDFDMLDDEGSSPAKPSPKPKGKGKAKATEKIEHKAATGTFIL
ncbi:hypothetical protein B0H14DRAFT_2648412 [Mycena olivaceomarginata]|nr:hypothetical protein B0H14DRAFT_2648412 [Mycena olivaceomarginata]